MSAEFLHALSALSALSTPSTNNPTDAATNLFLVIEPVDMRLGIDGLSSCIQTRLPGSPCAGGIYIFSNARRNRLKLLLWDATGVWLAQRRLHQGRFIWPSQSCTETHAISFDTWRWLTMGIDWTRLNARAEAHTHWRVG